MVRPTFSASRVQTSIPNSHHGYTMCGSMADIQSPTAESRRGKKEETTQLQFTYLLHLSHVTHQNLIGYISAISEPIHFWFSLMSCHVSAIGVINRYDG